MTKKAIECHLSKAEDTEHFAKQLSKVLRAPFVLFLHGELGSGKTTFVRGLLRGFGIQDKIKSPTYTLVEPYHLEQCDVFHFDLYRIQDKSELDYLDINEYFTPNSICLVEWPDYVADRLPSADMECYLKYDGEGRQLRIYANSDQGQACLQHLLAN